MKKTMVFGLPILMILLSAIIAASSASPHESTVAREYAAAVQISNRSDVKIAGVSIAYGSEKTVRGSMGCVNADGSLFRYGTSMDMELLSCDFAGETELVLSFCIQTDDGRNIPIPGAFLIDTDHETTYQYEIAGTDVDSLRISALQ